MFKCFYLIVLFVFTSLLEKIMRKSAENQPKFRPKNKRILTENQLTIQPNKSAENQPTIRRKSAENQPKFLELLSKS